MFGWVPCGEESAVDQSELFRVATIKEVARHAGVSPSTVSAVLNGTKLVSPSLRLRVEAAIHALGYHPNHIARSLKTKTTRSLGLVVPDMLDPSFSAMIKGIVDATAEQGFALLLADSEQAWTHEEERVHWLLARQVDGLIIAPVEGRASGDKLAVAAGRAPIVVLDASIPGLAAIEVRVDYEESVRTLVRQRIAAGHDRVAFIAPWTATTVRQAAFEGYRRALAESGRALDPVLVRTNNSSLVGGYKAFKQLMGLRHPPDAVLVVHHAMTLGAVKAIQELALRCPGDVCLVGFGDFDWAEATSPQVSVISPPYYELGVAAGKAITDAITTSRTLDRRRITLPARLVMRGSTCRSVAEPIS